MESICAAYVHVPFCVHRCGYCDFTLVAGRDDLMGSYLQALEIELQRLETPRPVHTLFLGGGTPTHLPPRELEQLLQLLERWFIRSAGCEFSVEANPNDLDEERVAVLAEGGVNRVSLGVQSFDARRLEILERDHRAADIVTGFERVRSRINNVAVDLIFGVPGQTLHEWRETLGCAVALGPQHISTYGLTFEKGTSFWTRRRKGLLKQAPEELERAMYSAALDNLGEAGYEHYELSNFARPGFRCRHNEVYWSGQSYYGVGPGAASYLDGVRRTNQRSVTGWIRRTLAGAPPLYEEERLDPQGRAREAVMLGLRRRAGIDLAAFQARHQIPLDALEPGAVDRFCKQGLLETVEGRLRLTREGCYVADSVVAAFL